MLSSDHAPVVALLRDFYVVSLGRSFLYVYAITVVVVPQVKKCRFVKVI